jgi:hypothetical protein
MMICSKITFLLVIVLVLVLDHNSKSFFTTDEHR